MAISTDPFDPCTLYEFAEHRWDNKEERENTIDHALKVVELIIKYREDKRSRSNLYGIKETWLGRQWALQLSQPDNYCSKRVIRSKRIRQLVQFRQLLVERRICEAARIMEKLFLDSFRIPPALLWRAGYHLLVRVSSHRPSADKWPPDRLRNERADSLDRFMFSIGKLTNSLTDKENVILEYVLHCLADEDCERASHVMQFFKRDTLPNTYQLAREPEAIIVYYLRHCYIGLAYCVLWRRRCIEAENQYDDEKHYANLEAKKFADLGFSCITSGLSQLIDLGVVVDVFIEPWRRLIKANERQEEETEEEEVLRRYSAQVESRGGSPNAHRFLAEWCEANGREEEALKLWMKVVQRAPDDWSVVKKCLQYLSQNEEDESIRLDLLFNFLDHPMAAERNPEAWRCLTAALRSTDDVCKQWVIRENMWRAAYLNPQSKFSQKPEVVELAALLDKRTSRENKNSSPTKPSISEKANVMESPKHRKRKLSFVETPLKKLKKKESLR